MKITLLLTVLILAVFTPIVVAGPAAGEDEKVVIVRVYKDGRITLDDSRTTLKKLEKAFTKIKNRGGAKIHYYVEDFGEDAHPSGGKILKLVTDLRIPLYVFKDEDCTTQIAQFIYG